MNPSIQTNQVFSFRKKTEKIDWRKLASIDVDYIVRNMDFEALQDILLNITFCNIEAELVNDYFDPTFIKIFKLAQLIIEYLLQTQEYIYASVQEISQELSKEKEENARLKNEEMSKLENQLSEMRKELRNRGRIISTQQHMMQHGRDSINRCPYCSKTFMTPTMLQSHIYRRHVDPSIDPDHNDQQRDEPKDKVYVFHDDHINKSDALREEWQIKLEKNIQELLQRIKMTEEINEKITLLNKRKPIEYDDHDIKEEIKKLKGDQRLLYENEMKRMRENFMKEMKEMNEKYLMISDELNQLKQTRLNGSMLGVLQDDTDADLVQQRNKEIDIMKNQFNKEIKSIKANLETQLEVKYKNNLKQMENNYNLKIQQFMKEAKEANKSKIVLNKKEIPSNKIVEDIEIFENSVIPIESDNDIGPDLFDGNKAIDYGVLEINDALNEDHDANIQEIKVGKNNEKKTSKNNHEVIAKKEIPAKKPKPPVRNKKRKIQKSSIENDVKEIRVPSFKDLKISPQHLALAKAEFEMELEKIGISKDLNQLRDGQYNNLSNLLNGLRTSVKQNFDGFDIIRNQCLKTLNTKSKKFIENILAKKSSNSGKNIKKVNLSATLPPRVPSQSVTMPFESSTKSKAVSLQNLSKQQPPQNINTSSSKSNKTTTILKQTDNLENNSINDDEDDDDDDDDEEEDSDINDLTNDDDDEDEDDSISNIDVDTRTKVDKNMDFNKVRNSSIKDKAQEIENQLLTRSSKKPVNGIDTIGAKVSFNPNIKKIIDDDDDAISLTSISTQGDKPTPRPRGSVKSQAEIKNDEDTYKNIKTQDASDNWDESD